MTNKSPPMPQLIGSTSPSMALAAIAASAAVPPRLRMSKPACGGQRLAGGDDAVFGHHHRAALGRVLRGTIVTGRVDGRGGERQGREHQGSQHNIHWRSMRRTVHNEGPQSKKRKSPDPGSESRPNQIDR